MKFNFKHLDDPSDILLVYEGKFDTESTKAVLHLAERNIDSLKEDPTIKRKVFNVLVECLQNVVKHGEKLDDPNPKHGTVPVLMIGRESQHYIISSGNAMRSDNVKDLKSRIEKINTLDKEGLKKLYKKIMRSNDVSDKGGAGLGLVDMARKSGEKLSYHFSPLKGKLSFFSLKTIIPRQITK
ncbi:MAG: hypothetical protein DHS20C17_19970 [Cyclobacteriaceae bacterium]|nr:MAG: hypothetical protein DHS20C17_19970 [Cyclobacteriaceae bacterium]